MFTFYQTLIHEEALRYKIPSKVWTGGNVTELMTRKTVWTEYENVGWGCRSGATCSRFLTYRECQYAKLKSAKNLAWHWDSSILHNAKSRARAHGRYNVTPMNFGPGCRRRATGHQLRRSIYCARIDFLDVWKVCSVGDPSRCPCRSSSRTWRFGTGGTETSSRWFPGWLN